MHHVYNCNCEPCRARRVSRIEGERERQVRARQEAAQAAARARREEQGQKPLTFQPFAGLTMG